MNPIKQTPDDDTSYCTIKLRDCQFNFNDLEFSDDTPNTNLIKERLTQFANNFYDDYDIVGRTEYDFLAFLQARWDLNKTIFEKYASVFDKMVIDYTDDKEVVYDVTTNDVAQTQTDEMPLDADDGFPTDTAKSNSQSKQTGSVKTTNAKEGDKTMVLRTEEFLDVARSLERQFVMYFKDCFIFYEVIT